MEAGQAVGRLDGVATTLPNMDLLVLMYIRAEAVLSSQIEGTQASLDDVLRAEVNLQEPGDASDVQEVINYIAALNYGLGRINALPVSLRLIRELHNELMAGVRGGQRDPGEFRRTQNWIGSAGATLQTARFVPPPVPEMQAALDNLEKFIYEDASALPPLLKVGLLHAQFETIHPFLDGNGRTGRLLMTLLLCHYGLLRLPLLYLSHYFMLHRSEYYDRLQAVRERGDWEGWLHFFLTGVRLVAEESTAKTREILTLREAHRALLGRELGRRAGKGLAVLEHLYQQPYISVRVAQRLTDQTYASANSLVADLVAYGILQPVGERQRDRVFAYQPYLEVFQLGLSAPAQAAPDEATRSESERQ
ncbi:Fic family protein [Deinococcus sp.]|uniref:Fic family protein n=1 Tax=Deinococcus sp. TaxID=47478 RepID=UPI003B5ACB07